MPSRLATGVAQHPHGHRTWLHLLPEDPEFVPAPAQIEATENLLATFGLAVRGPEQGVLTPGPAFADLLLGRRSIPIAGAVRGEVRLEAGVLRCYPDPGSHGFETNPPQSYQASCPGCGVLLEFFKLRFPTPDPMAAVCPRCDFSLDVSALVWSPRLPVARAEVTFGDLDGRPSLRGTDFFGELEKLWATRLCEVHVTL
ncbi:MAG: hypothetical protein WB801_05095 [Candidatus Dormiibacterota bacterium]